MPVTMPGQRDRQDQQERDGVPAEEAEPMHGEGGGGAEHQRHAVASGRDRHERSRTPAHGRFVPGRREPLRREVLRIGQFCPTPG